MSQRTEIFLPTEIIIEIVSFIAADEPPSESQVCLHACCLVSRQWYSASIGLLYAEPDFQQALTFEKFIATVCPPIAAASKRKTRTGRNLGLGLGSLVRTLDMGSLVHNSTKRVTARLLGRVKENLEVFIAPMVSFSINSLASLSKCYNLEELDLSLVCSPLSFVRLKKAIQHLDKLTFLSLPTSTTILVEELTDMPWPPRLRRLRFSGSFPKDSMESFSWPEQLSSLTLVFCNDLSVKSISSLICSRHLGRLSHLGISYANSLLQPESINAVPRFLPNLRTLIVPGDLLEDDFFNNLNGTPLSLEYLAIERGATFFPSLGFSERSLISALDYGLSNLRAVIFDPVYSKYGDSGIFTSINDALKAQWKRRSPGEFASREFEIGAFLGDLYE
ncbi:hypothetical protein V8E54_008960 [Elaphomyces granulatus]